MWCTSVGQVSKPYSRASACCAAARFYCLDQVGSALPADGVRPGTRGELYTRLGSFSAALKTMHQQREF